ncbi:hypothetical protein [Desulfosporosinus shakirovi]|uniref:hypothetical protein n=1 Tax=Desulfosporosinus shakirovi TaxID=2885154 RepID=UPI001E56C39C|nr:hypothetical protein [Desulfosporosinus sp. SRJS8]MCB8814709.1 hypothetical protein [Desulfosporosinus sp. SRJS8]
MCEKENSYPISNLKSILRPDVNKLKGVDADQLAREQPLPPMVWPQKIMLIMIPLYLIMLLIPSFLDKSNPVVNLLATLGPLGVTIVWIIFFCIIRYQGKEVLNFSNP